MALGPVGAPVSAGEFGLPSEDLVVGGLPLREYTFPGRVRDARRTLVCIPGFSASGRSFARLAPLAACWDVRMVSGPLDRPYPGNPVESLTEVIAEYITRFDRPVLLGTSFGGLVAINTALRMSRVTSGLILTAAFANGTRLGTLPFMRHVIPALQLAAAPLAPITARVVGGFDIDPAGLSAIIEDTVAISAKERARRLRTIFATNLLPRLPEIEAPALVIHGLSDHLVPRARAVEMARALPHCDYHEIRRAGHLPYVTHAEEFVAVVGRFLGRVAGPVASF
ncbi:MAG: alpha/beta hydrolase [Thermoanaerobaculia bacterium]|nr:alpha/beta hydrolase [Thermoanaerobaculia bacterium]